MNIRGRIERLEKKPAAPGSWIIERVFIEAIDGKPGRTSRAYRRDEIPPSDSALDWFVKPAKVEVGQ